MISLNTLQCLRCKTEIKDRGALIISPPFRNTPKELDEPYSDIVIKFHICTECYPKIMLKIQGKEE
jgi:hypothetical protein